MDKLEELQKAIEVAAEHGMVLIKKSQMAFDFSAPNPHHVAYTRTNASGTVSNIAAKGSAPAKPTIDHAASRQKKLTYFADTKSSEAFSSSELHDHRRATEAHRAAAEAYPKGSSQRSYHSSVADNHSDIAERLDAEYSREHEKQQAAKMSQAEADIAYDPQPGDDAPLKNPEKRYAATKPKQAEADMKDSEIEHILETNAGQRPDKNQQLIDGVHKVGNDLLNNPMLAEHHENIKNKLQGLKANPTAKAAAQVAGDLKLIAGKAKPTAMSSREAATHLQKLADHPSTDMGREIDNWNEAHSGKDIPADKIAGTESRHYTPEQVYGKRNAQPGFDDFSDEFKKIQEEHGHDAFVMNHHNGHQYLVDPQGYNYARYVGHIKKG